MKEEDGDCWLLIVCFNCRNLGWLGGIFDTRKVFKIFSFRIHNYRERNGDC